MDYQRIVIAGNVTGDAERIVSKDGQTTYTRFSVGVRENKGETTYFPIVLFGQLGESLTQYITKGRQILVDGRITVSESRFNVVADQIKLGVSPKQGELNRDAVSPSQ